MNAPHIRFTNHALNEIREERERGFDVSEELAMEILLRPAQLVPARDSRMFAQSPIDDRHLLRVLFEEENEGLVIITVYIGVRQQYEI